MLTLTISMFTIVYFVCIGNQIYWNCPFVKKKNIFSKMFKGSSQNVEKNCNFVGDNALIVRKPKFFFWNFYWLFGLILEPKYYIFPQQVTVFSTFWLIVEEGVGMMLLTEWLVEMLKSKEISSIDKCFGQFLGVSLFTFAFAPTYLLLPWPYTHLRK